MMKYAAIVFGFFFVQLAVCSDFFRPKPFTSGCLLGTSMTGFAQMIAKDVSPNLRILSFAGAALFSLTCFLHANNVEIDYNTYPMDPDMNAESRKSKI